MVAFIQNIGPVQLGIILLIVFIVFGAGRLPQVFEAFGKAIKSFRDAQKDDAIDVTRTGAGEARRLEHDADDADEVPAREKERAGNG